MVVYVDDQHEPAYLGGVFARWCNLWADTDAELHEFAGALGLTQVRLVDAGEHTIHYRVTEAERAATFKRGAHAINYGGNKAKRILRDRIEAAEADKQGGLF